MSTLEKREIVAMREEINMSKICCLRMRKGERKHIEEVHGGVEEGVEFDMKITHRFKNDPTGRQVMEGVAMRELVADHILNSKDEFCQPGEIIPVIPGREWRGNNGANNNSQQSQLRQQLQRQQQSDERQTDSSGSRHVSSGEPEASGEVSQEVSGEGVKTRARARREREEAGVTTRSRAAARKRK